jgi:protein-disulfide isomerase
VHPHAQLAAEASEAAADQGRFWEMHDLLLRHQGDLLVRDLVGYADDIGIDTARFRDYLGRRAGAARSPRTPTPPTWAGVSGTPTFFINDRRHYGAFDIDALTRAVRTAKAAALGLKPQPPAASPGTT